MVFIYILKFEKNKYYIGKTLNPQFRLENHFNNNCSEWTKLYKPLKVLKILPNCDDEDKYTKIYIDKYGIENIRGGVYTYINLDTLTKKMLKQINNSKNNKCFNCGHIVHSSKNYEYNKQIDADNIIWCYEYYDKEFKNEMLY